MMPESLFILYTGNGKGKTTAAIGLGIRAVGQGKRVKMLQFMKGPGNVYGETIAIRQYVPGFEIVQVGLDAFTKKGDPSPADLEAAQNGMRLAREALSGAYDLVILDEVNVAVDFGLLKVDEVTALIGSRNPSVDVVATGRYAPQELLDMADTVSEVKEIKHHFHKGIPARKGIEY
jgi:cob(I)alamin adenosyltransferase